MIPIAIVVPFKGGRSHTTSSKWWSREIR